MGEKKGILNFFKLDSLFDHLTAFIEAKIEIYKLEIKEEAAKLLSHVIVGVILFCLSWFFIMFLSVALGFYLAALLGSVYKGFLIISGFYLLMFIMLFLLRDKIGLKEFFEKKLTHWINPDK